MADIIEIEQLLARYAVGMTKDDIDTVMEVFTSDGTYSAFGDEYALADFPRLVAAAPKGLFLVGPPEIDLDGDEATGTQPLCFVDQTNHDMRIGYYNDTYRRTDRGWGLATPPLTFFSPPPARPEGGGRLATRSMTFLRRSGSRDSGRPHDPGRPAPEAS